MRIALVVSTFPPYQGGMGNMAFSYALGLTRRGHQVEVFCPERRKTALSLESRNASSLSPAPRASYMPGSLAAPTNASSSPFPVHRLKPWFDIRNSAFVPQLAARLGRFDAVNLHYPFYGGAEAVFLLKKLKGKKLPLVVNFQMDNYGSGTPGVIFKANARLFTPRLLRAADKVIVTSEDYAAHSTAAGTFRKYPEKFGAIPPGIDTARFSLGKRDSDLLNRYGITEGEKVVLFVGGLDRAHAFKGVDFLIRAWRELGIAKTRLLIVGEGDLRESYQRTADELGLVRNAKGRAFPAEVDPRPKSGAPAAVVFADPVGAGELPAYYRLADLLVLPSTDSSEAFGIVLVEAMACGVPVLASDLPGVRNVIESGRNGFIFRARETKDLLDKLRSTLLNDELRGRMRVAARETAVAHYDQEKIWDRVDKVFREIASA